MDTYKQFTDRIKPTIIKADVDLPFDATIASYQEWAESLPILNTQLSSNLMSTASMAMLSSNMSATDKFTMAEAAQPYVLKLLSSCKKEIAGAKLPLAQKLANISAETLSLLKNIHSIYMDIACSALFIEMEPSKNDGNTPVFSSQKRSLVICRAIELLSIIQFLSALLYKQNDQYFWNDANALFDFSEGLGTHQDEHKSIDGERSTSIENEFKKIHYFHLARTNRFNQIDITRIQRVLTLHAPDILMAPVRGNSSEFYVDLSSPTPIAHISDLKDSNHYYRFLSNENLIRFMLSNEAIAQEQRGAISLISDSPSLPKRTIQQILPSWSTTQSRQSPRHSQTEEVTVYPGFENIIRAYILKQHPNDFSKKKDAKNNPFDLETDNLHLIPMDSHLVNHHLMKNTDIIKALKTPTDDSISSNSIWGNKRIIKSDNDAEKMAAETNDASLQGLRFKVANTNKPLLKATDLIGIQTKTGSLKLAIIRRINNLDDGDVSVGVEMMSTNLKIAHLKFHNKELAPKPVIFLQGIPAIHQPDSIISPLLLENTHEDIVLKSKNKKSSFTIEKIIETNSVFTHYTVLKKTNLN